MWDIKSQGFEDEKDPNPLFSVQKHEFGHFPKHIPAAASWTNNPGLSFSRSCSRLTKFLESLKTQEETTRPSRSRERPCSHRAMLAQPRPPREGSRATGSKVLKNEAECRSPALASCPGSALGLEVNLFCQDFSF